ncbi:MAG: DUF11 domain-containing protein, partial [Spirulina sp. DLM2.Bin59]
MFRVPFLITLACLLLTPTVALAEGSRELKGQGDRPLLLYRDGVPLAGIPRQNKMFVYAKEGETINLGSSAVGVNQGRIEYIAPNGATGSCSSSAAGRIRSIAQENIGPFPALGGYTPCQVVVGAGQAGIWQVQFVSPDPSSNASFNLTTLRTAINNWNNSGQQGTNEFFVTAWDITVTDTLGVAVEPGRVFMNYLPGRLGQDAAFNSRLYVLTKDGFQYRIAFSDLDPDGFTLFANNKGFRNGTAFDSPPIFESVELSGDATGNNVPAGVSIHSPDRLDDSDNITHRLFVNPPSPELPSFANIGVNNIENWLRTEPEDPPEPQNFRFVGEEGTIGQAGSSPLTGSFIFTNPSSRTATYTIGLDLDGDGQITDNGRDRILMGIAQPGENIIPWDGLDGQGNPVPPGDITFQSSMTLAIGEVHFPLIDPENNKGGFVIERLNGPLISSPDPTALNLPADPFLIYYNNAALGGESAIAGVLSNNGAHRWTNNFGDEVGIDTWVNVPSPSIPVIGGFTIKEADLQITKRLESSTDPIAAGSTVTYIIEVSNPDASPSGVENVPVTDTIPSAISNVTWTCAGENGGVCNDVSGSGNNLNTTANLPRDSKVIYTITGIIDLASEGETIQNTARVIRPNDVNDPNEDNNKASTEPLLIGPPLPTTLSITKAPPTGQTTVSPGETLSYTIIVENTGTAPAFNVEVDDPIPTGLSFESNTGDCDTAYVCQLGTIPAGETRTIITTFTVPANYQGPDPIDNIAVASALNIGPDPVTSNTVSLTINPAEPPNLTLSKDGPATFNPGDTITYNFTVNNPSDTDAVNVILTDEVLTGLGFIFQPSDLCPDLPCDLGIVPPGATTFDLSFLVPLDYTDISPIDSKVTLTYSNSPTPDEPIEATLPTRLLNADLVTTKSGIESGPVGEYTYRIKTVNNGNDAAVNVRISDEIPAGVTVTEISDGGIQEGNFIVWDVDSLAAGTTVEYTVTVRLDTPGEYTNIARSTSDTFDPNPINNDGSSPDAQVTTIIPDPDPDPLPALSLTKTGPEQFNPGDTITYNFTVNNPSDTDAVNVILTDEVLTGLGFIFQPSDLCPDLPCDLGIVPPGATTFDLSFLVP